MSAPNTNLEKQERRHKVPLGGIASVLVFAGVLLVGLIIWTTYVGGAAEEPTQKEPIAGETIDNGVTPVPSE